MIEELWKRMRGINDWPETEAEVTGVFRFEGRRNRKIAVVDVRYKDDKGVSHTRQFRGDIYTSIYNVSMGDMINVRYDSSRPDRSWSDDCGLPVQTTLFLIWAVAAVALLFLLITSGK